MPAQSCLTLLQPPGLWPARLLFHGILQARILDWVAISSSRRSSPPRDQTCVSCIGKEILYRLSHQQSQGNDEFSLMEVGKVIVTSSFSISLPPQALPSYETLLS